MIDIQLIKNNFPTLTNLELLKEIATLADYFEFEEGDLVMDYGKPIRSIPLIIEGALKISRLDDNGHEIFLYYIEKGDTCATSLTCCQLGKLSTIKAVAEENTKLIKLPIQKMDEWTFKYVDWKNFVISTYSSRFEELLLTLDQVAFHQMDERLLQYLDEKAKITGSNYLNIKHQDIAQDLNSSREVISRLLKKMEKNGDVVLSRNQIRLL